MKITITATQHTTKMDGVDVRVWEGVTESGVKCQVFVHRIAVKNGQDMKEFERALEEMPKPTITVDLRYVLP